MSILPFLFHLFYCTCSCLLFITSVLSYKVIIIYLSLEFFSSVKGCWHTTCIEPSLVGLTDKDTPKADPFALHRIRVYISVTFRKSSWAQLRVMPLQHLRLDSVNVTAVYATAAAVRHAKICSRKSLRTQAVHALNTMVEYSTTWLSQNGWVSEGRCARNSLGTRSSL
jgi:hypothetical protein